ncbi:periplasmic heavy metal sensor [Rhodobacteraceae bacterium 2CG4]|uniref:Periplasmic heavy metal sensor n=1 Tax=Halovulum marinum TaxID=2662447 RepID=A0A6L5YW97_9RHOB|nr:periplasmic heavy metal sensor [Halovulum marinum]MSU88300.1 periplasmic heavy metal sensor [Halovulum marinum]
MSTPSAPTPEPIPRRMPRWAKLALVGSLALNLAVLGVVGGALLRGADRGRPLYLPIEGFRSISAAMLPEDRAALRRDLRARRDEIRDARRTLRRSQGEFIAALRADPFSSEALAAALDSHAEQWEQFGRRTREMLVRRISEMSPEARAAFAANLESHLSERRGARSGPKARREAER